MAKFTFNFVTFLLESEDAVTLWVWNRVNPNKGTVLRCCRACCGKGEIDEIVDTKERSQNDRIVGWSYYPMGIEFL